MSQTAEVKRVVAELSICPGDVTLLSGLLAPATLPADGPGSTSADWLEGSLTEF